MFLQPQLALLQICPLAWLALAAPASASNQDLVVAARKQVGITVIYGGSYRTLDHRHVPNLMVYFQRAGYSQPVTQAAHDYLPGDLVAWDLGRRNPAHRHRQRPAGNHRCTAGSP